MKNRYWPICSFVFNQYKFIITFYLVNYKII